jgi:amino acid permease
MSISSFLTYTSGKYTDRFGLWGGYFFCINAVIGSGFLTLPYAFNSSGWLFGLIFMSLMSLGSYYFSCELLEVLSRVECITQIEEKYQNKSMPRLTWREIIFGRQKKESLLEHEPTPNITDRRFDVSTLILIVFGKRFGLAYMVILYFFLTGAQISYFSIFCCSFAAQIPLGFSGTCDMYDETSYFGDCRPNYWVYWAVYLGFMIFMTIRGLKEQLWLQSFLTVMRFVIISLILFTCIALMAGPSNIDNDDKSSLEMPVLLDAPNMLSSLSIIIFSFIYHLQFPSIAECVKDKKKNLPSIIKMVAFTTTIVYGLLAMIVPVAITSVKAQCSIEYTNYSAGYSQNDRPWWTYFIAYLVVLFPAFDVFSSFPLMGISVSDNLMTLVYGVGSTSTISIKKIYCYRAFTVVLPAVISFFEYDLSFIIDWVGMLAMILVPISFPILHIATREMINVKSRFDAPFYSRVMIIQIFCLFISFVSIGLLIAIVVQKIINAFS